jgi:glycosyltransferase involved in cell wall biosynthesis
VALRILIDLQGAQNNSRHRGIGRYSLALTKGIARNAGEHKVFVLLNGLFPETIDAIQSSLSSLISRDRFLIFQCAGPVAELNGENSWRRRTAEILREQVIDSLAPDIVLITSMVEGADDDTVTTIGCIRSRVPSAAILYDLIPLLDPDRYIGWETARRWYFNKMDSLRRADLLLAISQFSMDDAIRELKIEPKRITNISSAADISFSSTNVSVDHGAAIASRFGIVRKFVMHSSAFDPRKNFQGLVRAYAALPRKVRYKYQLVLVCKLDPAGRQELTTLAAELGLAKGEMVLTGFVSDDDLVALYTSCYLFVFPSFQEGFGLPALEAMSCGTATLGSSLTSVPEVIGHRDALFDPGSIENMTSIIQRALTDSDFYQFLKDHAKAQAAKFSWDDTALRALASMEEAVTQYNRNTADFPSKFFNTSHIFDALAEVTRDYPATKLELLDLARCIQANDSAVNKLKASASFGGAMTWRIEGPFDSTYSLALLNRETSRALSALGHKVILHSTEGPGDFAANAQFLKVNPDVDAMHRRVIDYPHHTADVVSRNLYPPRVADMEGQLNLLHHYAWEESGFPSLWVADFNGHLDGITCLSTHVEKVLIDNGVHVPMTVSGAGVDHWERIVAADSFRIEARTFRFLHVSSCFPRKGIDALLVAYGKSFTDADDVSLVIKTFANPHNDVRHSLSECQLRSPNFPNVVVIEGDMTDSDLKALYQQCHVLVAPSRAEGFGLPLAEALLSGLPVITTAWSGQLDFCNEGTAWLVDYKFKRAETHFNLPQSVWAEPYVDDLSKALRTAFTADPCERIAKATAGRRLLLDNFKWSDVAARLVLSARYWQTSSPKENSAKIGWITTWNTKCGIASYSERLLAHFSERVIIFAPHETNIVGEDGPNCVRSWRSSKLENGFEELAEQIGGLGLNTLVLQFNYSFYNFFQLKNFIHEQINAGRVMIVMLHSTGDPESLSDWNWKLAQIAPALARCHRLLVHSVNDLNRLKRLDLIENVSLFPHGIPEFGYSEELTRQNEMPLIASYGYCLPHKGLLELVDAVALLRDTGAPVRLRLVNAEYPAEVSAKLVSAIIQRVADLGLDGLVELNNSYLSDSESYGLLRDADLIVFPYHQTNESASGAVRLALSTKRPVAVTPIPIFDDLGDAVHRFSGVEPQDLAKGMLRILGSIRQCSQEAKAVEALAETWRGAHGYSGLSARLQSMCVALSRYGSSTALVFDGSSRQLKTKVGQISGRSLLSTGVAGYLSFGPYASLAAGSYRVVVSGAYSLPLGSEAKFDVCSSGGKNVHAQLDLSGHDEAEIADVTISLAKGCGDLELRILVNDLAKVRLDRIAVHSAEIA